MTIDQCGYVAAYESHHVAYLESFSDYEKAATFLHGWGSDLHTWPICVYNAATDHLWLWCGYRTLDISREAALVDARKRSGVTVVVVETAIDPRVPGYESWWDVAIAEVSESPAVQDARKEYEKAKQKERLFL